VAGVVPFAPSSSTVATSWSFQEMRNATSAATPTTEPDVEPPAEVLAARATSTAIGANTTT
jgi:hypothetical protein